MTESGYIYFIKASKPSNLIKIGKTTGTPQKRFAEIQSMNGNKVTLLGFYRATNCHEEERELHSLFANDREHGEWFKDSDELQTFITEKTKTLNSDDIKIICKTVEDEIYWLEKYRNDLQHAYKTEMENSFKIHHEEKLKSILFHAALTIKNLRLLDTKQWFLQNEIRISIRRIIDPLFHDWKSAAAAINNYDHNEMIDYVEDFIEEEDALKEYLKEQKEKYETLGTKTN